MPHVRYKNSYLSAIKKFQERGSDNESTDRYLKLDLEYMKDNFDVFVQNLLETCSNPPENRVACTEFWIIDEHDHYCGRISLRHSLNETLALHGGHIGYDIVPSFRNKGYATAALRLCLEEAKKIGLDRVLLTCDDDNIASIKTIEKNGGVFQDLLTRDTTIIHRRYWIYLR